MRFIPFLLAGSAALLHATTAIPIDGPAEHLDTASLLLDAGTGAGAGTDETADPLLPRALPPPPSTEDSYTYVDKWDDELGADVSLLIPESESPPPLDGPHAPDVGAAHYVFEPELNATIPILLPDAIAPPHLRKRAPPAGPLYGSSGGPTLDDIRQTTIPNCGLLSSIAAVLHTNPRWLTDIISADGSPSTARTATYNVHQADASRADKVNVDKTRLPTNRGDRSEVWWNGGLEQAVLQCGQPLKMIPTSGLSIVTGVKSTHVWTKKDQPSMSSAVDKDGMWRLMQRAGSTPIVFQTRKGAQAVVGNHAYAVTGTSNEAGRRMVTMFNPWGSTSTYDLDRLWEDVYLLHHVNGFPGGPGGGGGGGSRDSNSDNSNNNNGSNGANNRVVVANEQPKPSPPRPSPTPTSRPEYNAAGARIVYETKVVTRVVVVSG